MMRRLVKPSTSSSTPVSVLRQQWRALSTSQRAAALGFLSDEDVKTLSYDWALKARDAQLEPAGDWFIWLVKPGRGWGKTRTGAETVRYWVESGQRRRIALVNDTKFSTNGVMVHGPDGILAVCPPWDKPKWSGQDRTLTWKNGAVAIAYSAEAPNDLRGPQHDGAWCDELTKWKNLQKRDEKGDTAWSNLRFGLRQPGPTGAPPRCLVTTTPRPIAIFKSIMAEPTTHVTHGALFENSANLAPTYLADMRYRYEGTRLGRQELFGEVIEQAEGALWTADQIDEARVQAVPPLRRIVVAIDPAATSGASSDETGIVVAGLGEDGHGYILDDVSGHFSPDGWARRAVGAYHTQQADRIVAEVNNGGEMVEHTVRTVDPDVSYKAVHASRGKRTRAEPVAALYEQGKVHHVGVLPDLESQMCAWAASDGEASPDRVDALVWALTELMIGEVDGAGFLAFAQQEVSTARGLKREDDQVEPESENPWIAAMGDGDAH